MFCPIGNLDVRSPWHALSIQVEAKGEFRCVHAPYISGREWLWVEKVIAFLNLCNLDLRVVSPFSVCKWSEVDLNSITRCSVFVLQLSTSLASYDLGCFRASHQVE